MDTGQQAFAIRRIAPGDGLLLRDLRSRSLEDAPEAFGQTLAEALAKPVMDWHRSALQSSHGDHRTWLLAERASDVVGLVQGRRRSPGTLLLFSMWVEPGSRRLGIGRALITALESWAGSWRATETVLWVFRHNSAAVSFYRDLGFEVLENGADAEAGARYDAAALRRGIAPATR